MPHWSSSAFAIVGLLAAVATIGTILVTSLRGAGRATALANYKDLAESYKMKTEEQAGQIEEQAGQIGALHKELDALRVKVETLTDLLTNRVALQDLTTSMTAMNSTLTHIADGVGRIEVTLAAQNG